MKNSLMYKEICEQPKVIRECITKNNELIRKLVAEIKAFEPVSIVIAARGTSDHVATYAKYLFEIFCALPVSLAAPSVMTAYNAKLKLDKTLVIGISQSGAGLDILEVIKNANESGAITIAITNTVDSALATTAKYHLDCYAGEEKSVAATKTFSSQLALVTALVSNLAGNEYLSACINKLELASQMGLDLSEQAIELSTRYRFMNECFVLARGLSYPIAMETALKISETCYIRAKAFAVSDFSHGPFALVDNNIPVILLAVDKATNKDTLAMIGRLKEVGAETLVITNDAEIAQQATKSIILPEWCEGVNGVFASIALIQTFACSLAVEKGNNPDAPRGLKKVTITK